MKIAVYTLPYELANEAVKINELFNAGLEELHLRKPCFKKKEYLELLNAIDQKFHSKIVLHNFIELANKFDVKGIHVTLTFFNGFFGKLRELRLPNTQHFVIATTIDKISDISSLHSKINHVFVGPMFKKYSAESIVVNFDPFQMKKAIVGASKKVYAMGGIDIKNLDKLRGIGLEGIILQSAIWKSDHLLNALNAFQLNQVNQVKAISNFRIA